MGNPNSRAAPAKAVSKAPQTGKKPQLIHVYARLPPQDVFVRSIRAQKLIPHSKVAQEQLQNAPGELAIDRIEIIGVTPQGLRRVIDALDWSADELRIKIHGVALLEAIAVYRAIIALAIQPLKDPVKRYMKYHISNFKLSPEDIAALEGLGMADLRSLAATRIANMFCCGYFTVEEVAALQLECLKHPVLDKTIDTKVKNIN